MAKAEVRYSNIDAERTELVLIGNEVAKRNALYQSVGMQFDHIHHVQGETGARMLFNSTLQGFDENAGKNRLGAIAKIGKGRDLSGVAQVRGSGALIGLQGFPFPSTVWIPLEPGLRRLGSDTFRVGLESFRKV